MLWKSLVTFDYANVKQIAKDLGLENYYKYLPLILTYRTIESKSKLGA